ncbi:MAG: hypothetical protein ACI8VC_001203 [Candidatus Endobugula sp.]|jgi:hypothetical protein
MKKLTTLLILLASFTFFSTSVLAVEAEGTIDEVRVCGASANNWVNVTYFKLSTGQWFFIHTNYKDVADRDDNASMSVVMTAYSSRYRVKVNVNHGIGNAKYNRCGITPAAGLWDAEGDYIAITEYSQ